MSNALRSSVKSRTEDDNGRVMPESLDVLFGLDLNGL